MLWNRKIKNYFKRKYKEMINMKKIFGMIIITVFVLALPSFYSFKPEKGFYAEYRVYEYPNSPTETFALLREHKEWDIKYIYIDDMIYKYQILGIKNNIAYIRICFEGTALGEGHNITGQRAVPFKRIFDIKINLNTLEMTDENGDPWGKWLFLIPLGSYDHKKYTIMKNWNDHGEVKGWIYGPYENEVLYSILHSPYVNNTTNFFRIDTLKKVKIEKDYTYGIVTSYKDYRTPEGTIRSGGYGGYYLDEIVIGISMGGGKTCEKTYDPGLNTSIYYTEDGLFIETLGSYWIDDFVDQKLGIVVLQTGNPLFLTDYGVSRCWEGLLRTQKILSLQKHHQPLQKLQRLRNLQSKNQKLPYPRQHNRKKIQKIILCCTTLFLYS